MLPYADGTSHMTQGVQPEIIDGMGIVSKLSLKSVLPLQTLNQSEISIPGSGIRVNINFTNCARNHENTLHILIEVNSMSNAVLNPIDSRNPTQPNPDRQSLVDQLDPARGLCNWHRTDSKWTLNLTSPTLSWLDLSQISFFLLESDRSEAFLIPSTKLIIFGRVYLATLVQITISKKRQPGGCLLKHNWKNKCNSLKPHVRCYVVYSINIPTIVRSELCNNQWEPHWAIGSINYFPQPTSPMNCPQSTISLRWTYMLFKMPS